MKTPHGILEKVPTNVYADARNLMSTCNDEIFSGLLHELQHHQYHAQHQSQQ